MTDSDAMLLATLSGWAFGFLLVMARIGAATMFLPGLGETGTPTMLRLGLALGVTALLLPGLIPIIPLVPEVGLQTAFMIAGEVLTGLWLGWLARLLALALPIAGQLIAYMLGIANVLQPDPELGSQATPLARLFAIVAPLTLLVSGLYTLPLAALAASYQVIPPGTLLPDGDSTAMAVAAVAQSVALAIRLASPFLLATIVWHVATGLMARLVPRLQIYFVAMPGQILGGLLLLAVLASPLLAAWQDAVRSGFAHLIGS